MTSHPGTFLLDSGLHFWSLSFFRYGDDAHAPVLCIGAIRRDPCLPPWRSEPGDGSLGFADAMPFGVCASEP